MASQSGSPTWKVKETPSSLDWPLQGGVQAIRCGVPSAAHTISPEKTCGSFQPLKAMLPFCRLSLRKTHPEQVVRPSSPACVLPVGRGVELLQDDGEQVEIVPSQIPQTPPGRRHQLARDEPSGSAAADELSPPQVIPPSETPTSGSQSSQPLNRRLAVHLSTATHSGMEQLQIDYMQQLVTDEFRTNSYRRGNYICNSQYAVAVIGM